MRFPSFRTGLFTCLLLLAPAIATAGGDPNVCDEPGDSPDVIVGSIHEMEKKGSADDKTAFSIGTTSCNVGTCWLNWFSGGSNEHPVIGQNMFRLKDGRFEHIGQSWLKHGFFALSGNLCSGGGCESTNGDHLGVNCSDPYSSFLNGQQSGMGPKFEVHATTGFHPHPVTDQGQTGNPVFKRLQVRNEDLDPSLNPGAIYWVEAQYIAEDDAGAGNSNNNASYRSINVTGSNGNYNASLTGTTTREAAAIEAWVEVDPSVELTTIDVSGDGRFFVGVKVTDLGGGAWRYEYAVQNLNSHRSAMSFSVPVGGTLTNIGFHDVDYHSGEPYDNVDWSHNGGSGGMLTWTTGQNFGENPDANALRWGTLYNFRFESLSPPDTDSVTLGLYRPGIPSSVSVTATTPRSCDHDGTCDPGEDCASCPDDCADGTCDPGENCANCPDDCANGTCDPGESCANCPDDCANGTCEPGETSCNCPDCPDPAPGERICDDGLDDDCNGLIDCADLACCQDAACFAPDGDVDGFNDCEDCDDGNNQVWAVPGEVREVLLSRAGGTTTVSWLPPADTGGSGLPDYEVLRSRTPSDFVLATACLFPEPFDHHVEDSVDPNPGLMFAYLVRALNACPGGVGTLGSGTETGNRSGRSCP